VTGGRPDLWLRETVSAFGGESPKDLARSLIDAQEAPGSDDRTALVVRLERRKL
jgi:stage II sporulation protein E